MVNSGKIKKRSFWIVFILLLIASLVATHSTTAKKEGDVEKTGKIVVLPKNEVVESDYFAAGSSATISGTVKGDAYIVAGTIDFEGTIDGDLIAAGGVINVRGTVTDDLRLCGGQVIISGDIKGNLTVAGGSVTLTDSANINGSLITAGGNVNIFGPIGDNAIIGAGNLTIGNRIGGNVNAGAGEIKLTSNALIAGDLNYYSRAKAQIQEGAEVKGEVSHKIPHEVSPGRVLGAGFIFYLIFEVISALIVGLLLLKIYPNFVDRVVDIIQVKSLNSLGIGFLGIIVIPVIFLILILTIIGIPLGIIIILPYFIYLYLSKVFVSLFIGRRLLKLFGTSLRSGWALLIGLVIFVIVTSIPFIGGIIYLIFLILGFGALLIFYKQTYSKLRSENVV